MEATARPLLDPAWELQLAGGRGYVVRAADGQRVAALTAFEAVTLSLMDGHRTWRQLHRLLEELAGRAAVEAAGAIASRLAPLIADGGERAPLPAVERLARLRAPAPEDGLRPIPGPVILHWWVTSICPRRCVYCFAQPIRGGDAPDATLPRGRLREIFAEARSLGARTLLAAGAEPLLRADLPEVLGDAIAAGIEPVLTTKHPIDAALAARLARAGVAHLCFSIDAVDDETNRLLVGAPGYARQVRRSMQHLREAGIQFSLEAVVTAQAPTAYHDVIRLGIEAAAVVVQVVPYERVLRPIGRFTNEELELGDGGAAVRAHVAALAAERRSGTRVEVFEQLGSGGRAAHQCDIGMTKLFFLPDGTVHRCYKLRDDPRLSGCSLATTGVAAAWHDPGYREVIAPPAAAYRGTSCEGCGRFGACHGEGRCIYQAFVDHCRYEAPDRRCERDAPRLRLRLPVVPS